MSASLKQNNTPDTTIYHAIARSNAAGKTAGKRGKKTHAHKRDIQLGKDISFGLEQTAACFATDFIDPVIGKWVQTAYGDKAHEVTHAHVWGGEVVGDFSALGGYLLTKQCFRPQVEALTHRVEEMFRPRFTRMGKKAIAHWAREEGVEDTDPEYQEKLSHYVQFQAHNIVDSSIVAGFATGVNVGAQKYLFGNRQALRTILTSKLVGAAATMGVMLGSRTVLPDTTKSLDEELSTRWIAPLIRRTKALFGVAYSEETEQDTPNSLSVMQAVPVEDLHQRLTGFTRKKLTHMVARHALDYAASGKDEAVFMAEEKRVLQALASVLEPDQAFSTAFASMHHEASQKLYKEISSKVSISADELIGPDISRQSVCSILNNRVQDLRALADGLEQPEIRNEIAELTHHQATLQSPLPVPPKKREALIDSLLQPAQRPQGEPAVHVYANARGQLMEHFVLAQCFEPEGALSRLLSDQLQQKLPDLEPERHNRIAKNYLADRQWAALQIVNMLRLDGDLVGEAVARSHMLQGASTSRSGASLSI